MQITSRFAGTVKALHYALDDMAVVGQPLLDIDIADDLADETPVLSKSLEQGNDDIQFEPPKDVNNSNTHIEQKSSAPASTFSLDNASSAGKGDVQVTPAVRQMLKQHNLDPTKIKGSGRNGRIMKEDVQQYLSTSLNSTSFSSFAPPISELVTRATGEDRIVSLSAIQSQMLKTMTRSLTIPHFLYTHTVDVTSLNDLRQKFNADAHLASTLSSSDELLSKITPLPIIIKAVSQAFLRFPRLNSHFDTTTDRAKPQLTIKSRHNFGLAVETPQGLLTPVLRDVQNHSVVSLANEIKRLRNIAREGRLKPDDFKDASFIVSNIGSIGGTVVSPVIVAPMVGILGIGRAQQVPVFRTNERGVEELVKREQIVLSWSADHRILDGATIARAAEVVGAIIDSVETLGLVLR